MKTRNKLVAILVTIALCISLMPAAFAAQTEYQDVDGHWAEAAIMRWTEYGVLVGSEGLFAPDQNLTRGQLATIISQLLKLKPAESANFKDVDENEWYADYINRCAAAGILYGYDGMARPNDTITREEAMVMLGRALNIKPAEKNELDGFADKDNVSDWAVGYVAALVGSGIVNGIEGELVPGEDINRASTATILNLAIGTYANEAGQTVNAEGTGIVIVTAPDVTVTGSAESVLVAPGAEAGTVTLSGTSVEGSVTVVAENATVVVANETKAEEVTLKEEAAGARIVVEEGAAVSSVTTQAANSQVTVSGTVDKVETTAAAAESKVEVTKEASVGSVTTQAANSQVTVSGTVDKVETTAAAAEAKVEVTKEASVGSVTTQAANSQVLISGTVDKVETTAEAAEAKVEVTKDASVGEIAAAGENTNITVSGKVDNVTVADTASNTTVEAADGSSISKVDNAAEGTSVTGSGKVDNVTTSGDNTTINTPGTKVDVAEGTSGTTADGKDVAGGESSTTEPVTPPAQEEVHYHSWGEGEITTPATCTTDGVKTYTCACGQTRTEAVPATGHTEVVDAAVNATCTESGLTQGKHCSVCNEVIVAQNVVPATGHSYAYTDNEDGTHTGTCACGDTISEKHTAGNTAACTKCEAAIEAKIGTVGYSTLADALAVGGQVVLLKDLTKGNIWLKDGVTLDLGGHTIDANGGYGLLIDNGNEATVKNGTISNCYSALVVFGTEDENDPTVVTADKDVTIRNSSYGVIFSGYHAEHTFTGKTGFATLNYNGTIDVTDDQCAMFVMGNLGNDAASAAAIGENGNQINIGATAKITATTEAAIVLNGMAKLTVVDGAVIEGADAITMKRGYLNISGGSFKGTGDRHTPTDAEHSGAENSGSAITVSSTYNYSGLIDVKISGGEFTSTNSYGFYAGQSVDGGNQVAFTNTNFAISGGEFTGGNGGVFFATGKYITGGTFSHDPTAYVAPGYGALPEVQENGSTLYKIVSGAVVSSEEELRTAVSNGGTVYLANDITLTDNVAGGVNLTKSVEIDGKGHKITSGTGLDRVFNVNSSVSENATITIKNTKIIGPTSGSNTRGISMWETTGLTLNLENCEVSASYYAINIASSNSDITVNITDCTAVGGWCAIQSWSDGAEVNISNSTLIGTNDKSYNAEGWNDFSTLIINGGVSGNEWTLENTKIVSSAKADGEGRRNGQILIDIRNGGNTVTLDSDCTFDFGENRFKYKFAVVEASKLTVGGTVYQGYELTYEVADEKFAFAYEDTTLAVTCKDTANAAYYRYLFLELVNSDYDYLNDFPASETSVTEVVKKPGHKMFIVEIYQMSEDGATQYCIGALGCEITE